MRNYSIFVLLLWAAGLLSYQLNRVMTFKSASTVKMSTAESGAPSENKASNAALSLIKKGKMRVVQSLIKEIEAAGDSHAINRYLSNGEYPFGVLRPVSLHSAINNNKGTIAVLPEFNKKAKTGFIIGMPPPEILGGVLRDAGAKAIVISLDNRSGGATIEEFERFCREQSRARLFLPGPLSIIYHDVVVDKIQISQAAALGGAAVTLWPEVTNNLAEFVDHSKKVSIEPIVMVKNMEEGETALRAGARYLCIHSLEETAIVDLKNQLSDSQVFRDLGLDSSKVHFMARLRPEEDFSIYHEIDICWVLRDEGFAAVWPSPEAVYGTGMRDVYGNVNAMRAKASRVFLSPRQFLMDRNKEGAKEYLGDILY